MLPGRSRLLKVRRSAVQGRGLRPRLFSYLRADSFLLPNIASDSIQRFAPYLAFVTERIRIHSAHFFDPMLYSPDHLFTVRNCAFVSRFPGGGTQIDMQARSNKRTQRNAAFAALWV